MVMNLPKLNWYETSNLNRPIKSNKIKAIINKNSYLKSPDPDPNRFKLYQTLKEFIKVSQRQSVEAVFCLLSLLIPTPSRVLCTDSKEYKQELFYLSVQNWWALKGQNNRKQTATQNLKETAVRCFLRKAFNWEPSGVLRCWELSLAAFRPGWELSEQQVWY